MARRRAAPLLTACALASAAVATHAVDCSIPLAIVPIPDMRVHLDFPVDYRAAITRTQCGTLNWFIEEGPAATIGVRETVDGVDTFAFASFSAVVDSNTMTYPLWRDYRTEPASVDVIGRAHGDAFESYALDYAQADTEDWLPVVGPVATPVTVDGLLAQWDVSALPDGGRYKLRLTVDASDGGASVVENQVILDRTMKAGWSKRVEALTHSVVLADLDDDGRQEVIAVSHVGSLYVWDIDGSERWRVEIGGSTYSTAAVGDIDGDGRPEIVWANPIDVYAYRANGDLVAGFPVRTDATQLIRTTPSLADLDGDGRAEILVVARGLQINEAFSGRVYAYTYDPLAQTVSHLPGWPQVVVEMDLYASASLADLDDDGAVEVLVAGTDHVWALACRRHRVAGWAGGVPLALPITGGVDQWRRLVGARRPSPRSRISTATAPWKSSSARMS